MIFRQAARIFKRELSGRQYSDHTGYHNGYEGCYGQCRQLRAGERGTSGYGFSTPCVHRGPPPGTTIVGQLSVTVVSISALSDGILALSHNKIEDPFVIVQLAKDYSRTRILEGPVFGSLDWPTGNEMFFRDMLGFPIWASHSSENIKFFVYGKKKPREEKYLASAKISIGTVLTQGFDEVILSLLSRDGLPYGQIHVRLRYDRRNAAGEVVRGNQLTTSGISIPHSSSSRSLRRVQSGSPGDTSFGSTIVVYNVDEDAFIAVPEEKWDRSMRENSSSPDSSTSSSLRSVKSLPFWS